jgi:hypothetical protein
MSVSPSMALSLRLSLSPAGRLHLQTGPAAADEALDAAAAERIGAAFAASQGHGLLHLGAAEVDTPLEPSLAFFRELGRLFVTALRGMADVEEQREQVRVAVPAEALAELVLSAPPMEGAEYLDAASLERLLGDVEAAFHEEIRGFAGSVEEYLQAKSPLWSVVGRVHFHLAENKNDPDRPFAFLATYTARLSQRAQQGQARVQHLPLGQALEESSHTGNKQGLLALLVPVERAAARSALLKELFESGELFHPLAWTAAEAYRPPPATTRARRSTRS